MAIDPQDVLVVTTENVPGYKTRKVIGEVFGVTSRSRNVVSNFGAGLKTLVGGEIGAFTNLLHETRLEAIGRLRVEAASRGANAVVMMRFDNESIAQTVGGTVAYGTAVLLEPEVQ
ncbi:MAG: heavy metal-binding domain-containing protein [Coriobacteriales bacterium]|nr:heavy metal-binding domain-containing protein [Coriobacteriales bacterium]